MDDTRSPCSDFTLSSWHPLKWRWALGPHWPDSTLALRPLNTNKDHLWIIDTNTTNEETLSQLFCWHTNKHTAVHGWTFTHSCIDELLLLLFSYFQKNISSVSTAEMMDIYVLFKAPFPFLVCSLYCMMSAPHLPLSSLYSTFDTYFYCYDVSNLGGNLISEWIFLHLS